MEGERGNSTKVISFFLALSLKVCAKVNYSWAGAGRALCWLWQWPVLAWQKGHGLHYPKVIICWSAEQLLWQNPLGAGLWQVFSAGHQWLLTWAPSQPGWEQCWVPRHSSANPCWQQSRAALVSIREGEAGKGFSGDLVGCFVVFKRPYSRAWRSRVKLLPVRKGVVPSLFSWTKKQNFWGILCIL